MNVTIERRRSDCNVIGKGWQKEEIQRKGNSALANNKIDVFYYRNMRPDTSLVPPIRQTASIFKQPVTVHKTQTNDSIVKSDVKHGTQEKPKQLFWEKRLEGLKACDTDGSEFGNMELPKRLRPVGPNVNETTLLQSVSTALHINNHPVTGQTANKNSLQTNSGVYLNPDQPLMHLVSISEDDIKRQEERVQYARLRLQEALKA
uniref:Putative mbd-like protein n=1 Tax=Corethrella appendiculata TaxID=1370023 RepID=U5EQR4_9DIPT